MLSLLDNTRSKYLLKVLEDYIAESGNDANETQLFASFKGNEVKPTCYSNNSDDWATKLLTTGLPNSCI